MPQPPRVRRPRARAARPGHVLAGGLLLLGVLSGCSDPADEGADAPRPTATPTEIGDQPLVELVEPGGEPRRRIALAPEPGDTPSSITITQRVVTDERPTAVPPVTLPLTTTVVSVGGDRIEVERTYGRAEVEDDGYAAAAVRQVRASVAPLEGLGNSTVLRPDGTTVPGGTPAGATSPVDDQLARLVPVLPADEVGPGASWTVTSVVQVDGATVEEVATYTLEELDGDRYVIGVSVRQTYRPGEFEGVAVGGGSGSVSARLSGTLTRVLPEEASADATAEVSYTVGDRVTLVRTTVRTDLAGG